jgi:hypothetical protein
MQANDKFVALFTGLTLEDKLRAMIAGMRYAADRCDEYADQALSRDTRAGERGRASAYRSDAKALEVLLDAHTKGDEVTRA